MPASAQTPDTVETRTGWKVIYPFEKK